ncbi:MarR family winged helix-turn-helix transcriptional regulator [Candidatus Odyssella thessalonicensis]|uniref:MarR family winged helix-turn-helix transcriptional regulator n=1 Tax=Candidatus Odyssella thessalonicensis TaxID=84647 RepID=UPI000496E7B2|nr:MarR family winged helix-turn-helix transcriptional regulator [Candidatus Odyssella thessalonicensis]
MKDSYFKSVVMIERLHRLFLDVVRTELDRLDIRDINNVQCLVLYNIGKGQVTVGELTNRGYYLGSNVSYNLRKMVQNGYLVQEPSAHDRRSSHVRLSAKGIDLHSKLDSIFKTHAETLKTVGIEDNHVKLLDETLHRLETFWTGLMKGEASHR